MEYNKLVRDRIPDILREKGLVPIIHIANDKEYFSKLKEKLREEVDEYNISGDKNELCDIIEVIYTICNFEGTDIKKLETIRRNKREKRGGFEKKIILEEVKDKI